MDERKKTVIYWIRASENDRYLYTRLWYSEKADW